MKDTDLMIMLGVRTSASSYSKYNYFAMDSDGEWFAYVNKPVILTGSWGGCSERLYICDNDGSNSDWVSSVREIPKPHPIQHIGSGEQVTFIKTSANLYEKVLMEQIEDLDVKINTLIALKADLRRLLENN